MLLQHLFGMDFYRGNGDAVPNALDCEKKDVNRTDKPYANPKLRHWTIRSKPHKLGSCTEDWREDPIE